MFNVTIIKLKDIVKIGIILILIYVFSRFILKRSSIQNYLNEINNKYTPQDKLKVVLKSFGILQNSITFCSGKKELGVDDTIKPLIYVLIKSKPKKMFSNYNYSQLFLSDDLGKTQYGILLTQIYMIMNIIFIYMCTY